MTAASVDLATMEAARPQIRPEIVLGGARRRGEQVVHYLRDPLAAGYHCVGDREYFLISRLDGQRTLGDIGKEYLAAYGRRLGVANWQRLLTLLAQRGLLYGVPRPTAAESTQGGVAEAPADAASLLAPPRNRPRSKLLYRRFPLMNPDRFFGALAARLGWLFHVWFVLPASVAIVAMEVYVATHLSTLITSVQQAPLTGAYVPLMIVVVWLTLAVHESAHGVACKRYGGSVSEIGILWRLPIVSPYCNADDAMLFVERRHSIYTAFAGTFAHLLTLLPMAALWLFAPVGSGWHGFGATILVFGNVAALLNLIPFLRFDGYFMLNHALGLTDLQTEANRYWRRRLRGEDLSGYPPGDRLAYAIFGIGSLVVTAALYSFTAGYLLLLVHDHIGPFAALAIAIGLAAFVTGYVMWRRRRWPGAGDPAPKP